MHYILFKTYLLQFDGYVSFYFDQKQNNKLENIFIDPIHNKDTYSFLFNELINLLEEDHSLIFDRALWEYKMTDISFQKELYFNIHMLELRKTHGFLVEYFDFNTISEHLWWRLS